MKVGMSTCYTYTRTQRSPKDLNSTKLKSHRICSPGFSCLRLRAFAYLPKDRFEEGKFIKKLTLLYFNFVKKLLILSVLKLLFLIQNLSFQISF